MRTNGQPELDQRMDSLRGLRCWYVSSGGAAGSTFELALGNKVPRPVLLKNPTVTEEFRHFEGEANLLVWCAWRLDGVDAPLTSWDDTPANVQTHLGHLVGAAVEAVTIVPPAWELTIRFSGNLTLRVFCDHVPPEPSFDGNWELWRSDVALLVGPGARYVVEARAETALSVMK
jgi:hypothetical protein